MITSKEALDKLRKHDGFIPLGEELDLFDIIEKDLEVLEEIKENHQYLYNLYKKTEEKKNKQRRMTNGECLDYIAKKSNLDFPRGDESDDLIDDKLYGCFIQLDAELKALEEYRKIMGTPIQDIMKRLKVLEILKELAKGVINLKENNIDITKYVVLISESTNEKIKDWLNE